MKRILLFAALFLAGMQAAFAWGEKGHATVAVLAERHLTPEARQAVTALLGCSIVDEASWMDKHRKDKEYAYTGSETIDTALKPQIEDKYDIYLLIGQSNMAGRGYMTDADKTEKVDKVYLLGPEDTPVVATHPFNQYSTIRKDLSMQQINPGYGFALEIRDKTGGRPVLLVCNARGGTTIQEWAVGTQYYNEAVRRTLAAMQYGRLKGILWHQGCGNSGAVTNGTIDYLALLKTMADTMRSDLHSPDIPFIAGELPYWRSTSPKFNEMIRTISTKIDHSGWVSAEGCTMRADASDPHFSRDGQILLGKRYGEKIIEMVYSGN